MGLKFIGKSACTKCVKSSFLGTLSWRDSPSPDQIKVMVNYPEPRTEKQVQSFLALAGILRKFIWTYARIGMLLRNLLRNDVTFEFGQQHWAAFQGTENGSRSSFGSTAFPKRQRNGAAHGCLTRWPEVSPSVLREPEDDTYREKVSQLRVKGHGRD